MRAKALRIEKEERMKGEKPSQFIVVFVMRLSLEGMNEVQNEDK